jgi:hypothetical protein
VQTAGVDQETDHPFRSFSGVGIADGVWEDNCGAGPQFQPLGEPDTGEVADVAADAARRIGVLLGKRGLGEEVEEAGSLLQDCPGLADLMAASIQGRTLRGKRQARLGSAGAVDADPEGLPDQCAAVSGFSLHAGVVAAAGDRSRLESLCRYAARPAFSSERLRRLPDGRLAYRLKRPWRDGTTEAVFEPEDLLARLAALVPPPRAHAVRYYGVFAPGAAFRPSIVPGGAPPAETNAETSEGQTKPDKEKSASRRNYSWALLMRRVFGFDMLKCPGCGGRMRIIAAIEDPEVARRFLDCLGLPSRAPPVGKARRNPQCDGELT